MDRSAGAHGSAAGGAQSDFFPLGVGDILAGTALDPTGLDAGTVHALFNFRDKKVRHIIDGLVFKCKRQNGVGLIVGGGILAAIRTVKGNAGGGNDMHAGDLRNSLQPDGITAVHLTRSGVNQAPAADRGIVLDHLQLLVPAPEAPVGLRAAGTAKIHEYMLMRHREAKLGRINVSAYSSNNTHSYFLLVF